MKQVNRIMVLVLMILCFVVACIPVIEEEVIEDTDTPEETTTIEEPTAPKVIIIEPTPTLDVSGWIVKIGELECSLAPLGDGHPEWYLVTCPEQAWLPISQITPVEIIMGEGDCDLKPAEDFEEIKQEYFPDALQLKFVEMEDGMWGCQVPFSDTAGIEVVCGLECGGKKE